MHFGKKNFQIDKARENLVLILAGAVVIAIFSLVSAKRLWSQAAFQRHVINARRDAANALRVDVDAANKLVNSFQVSFNSTSRADNILGGKNTTAADAIPPDGTNPRLVLDALPSSYDFPALITSLTQLMKNNAVTNATITGTDKSATTSVAASASPQRLAIPLTISGSSDFGHVQALIKDLERSIRPFDVTSLDLRGSNQAMSFSINLTTYFQAAKVFDIKTMELR